MDRSSLTKLEKKLSILSSQATGLSVSPDVADGFEDFKLQKGDYKGVSYIIYRISDDKKNIIVDKIGGVDEDYDAFVESLPENNCRYAVVDIKFETADERQTSKLVFMSWSPDTCKVREKMIYAGSKEYLKSSFAGGIGIAMNATDLSELDFETAVKPLVERFA